MVAGSGSYNRSFGAYPCGGQLDLRESAMSDLRLVLNKQSNEVREH